MTSRSPSDSLNAVRPAEVCKALLATLDASEGRRRKRKRNTTPDAIGLALKRDLLERVVEEDPSPETFEDWLLNYALVCTHPESPGAASAMARSVLEEWRLAHSLEEFRVWLDRGAPSDDASEENQEKRSDNRNRGEIKSS